MQLKTDLNQSNFFKNYNKKAFEEHKKADGQLVESSQQLVCPDGKIDKLHVLFYAQQLKLDLGEPFRDALDDVATRIQKRINRGTLSSDDLERYQNELEGPINMSGFSKASDRDYSTKQKEKIDSFMKCCIVLSKHCTKDSTQETKLNYFLVTNKTSSISQLINEKFKSGVKPPHLEKSDQIEKEGIDTLNKILNLNDPSLSIFGMQQNTPPTSNSLAKNPSNIKLTPLSGKPWSTIVANSSEKNSDSTNTASTSSINNTNTKAQKEFSGKLFIIGFDGTIANGNVGQECEKLFKKAANDKDLSDSVKEKIAPTGGKGQWAQTIQNLIAQNHFVSIVSFNSHPEIIKKYLSDVVGLNAETMSKIYVNAWLSGIFSTADKNIHIEECIKEYCKRANTDTRPAPGNVVLIDDNSTSIDAAYDNRYQTIKVAKGTFPDGIETIFDKENAVI